MPGRHLLLWMVASAAALLLAALAYVGRAKAPRPVDEVSGSSTPKSAQPGFEALPHSGPGETVTPAARPKPAYRANDTDGRMPLVTGFPDPTVYEVFLKFTHMVSTGYNRTNEFLFIKFKGGVIYSYLHVPESVFLEFLAAESHGAFAQQQIYPQYEAVRH